MQTQTWLFSIQYVTLGNSYPVLTTQEHWLDVKPFCWRTTGYCSFLQVFHAGMGEEAWWTSKELLIISFKKLTEPEKIVFIRFKLLLLWNIYIDLQLRIRFLSQVWWHTSVIPLLRVQGKPWLHNELRPGFITERDPVRKEKEKRTRFLKIYLLSVPATMSCPDPYFT